ncbi:AAA family ATPase [Marinobacterium litorale]|uniref:AAA family ATPase n=1 Tax=Marinobacterium litorale TaxID=404770 RepID=UPI0004281ADF|nr:ATP-binding protein [Marinobacterium litorale]
MTAENAVNVPESVSIGTVAPITNVGICIGALQRIMHRDQHLPGMAVLYGPAGFGKSLAASYAANKTRAYYVTCKSSWTKKALLLALAKEMGLEPAKTLYEMCDQVCEQLALSQRPLIIDEMDHVVEKNAVEIVRDIYEGSFAPILLIGEEKLPAKLERWERFHSRILEFVPAQPVSADDAEVLQEMYCPEVTIAPDLMDEVLSIAKGSVRRVVVNISRIRNFGLSEGLETVDQNTWGNQPLFTGKAPARRVR